MHISQANMDRRKRMADLQSALTDVIADHAADWMTTAEVVAVLLDSARRLIGHELRDELAELDGEVG